MIYRFGDNELDDSTLELRRAGRRVPVQPKVLQLLLQLVRQRPRVVSKADLMRRVWPDAVVTDGSLARAISLARRAVGDGDPPAAILSVTRVGYRFAAEVEAGSRLPPAADRYVGRARLRARVEEMLDRALGGRGRTLLLMGEAGIGKTRTASLLLERARAAGARVVDPPMEAGEATGRPWLGVLSALQRSAPECHASLPAQVRADLATLFPELEPDGQRGAPPIDSARRGALHARHAEALTTLLERAAADGPLVLLLEDLHVADSETLWLLEAIAPRIARMPIAIVATSRERAEGASQRHADALARVLRATGVERWPLAGLDADEIRRFVEQSAWAEPDPGLLAVLAEQTSGNPLLLRESLRSLEARGLLSGTRSPSAWRSLLPVGVRHLLEPVLARLPVEALEVLGVATVCGVEARWSVVAECLKADTFAVGRACCESVGLLRSSFDGSRMRFSHALIREALLEELVPEGEARRGLHARVWAALEGAGEEAEHALEEEALHACLAVPLVAPLEAARRAIAAAEEATRRLGFERAAEWYRRALEVLRLEAGDMAELKASALLGLATSETRVDGLDGARVHFSRAADLARRVGRADLLARAALGFAHRPSASGSADPEVLELLEEAIGCADALDPGLALRVRSRLAAELRYADPAKARALGDAALAAARSLGDPAVLAVVLDDACFLHQSSEEPLAWLALNAEIVRAARDAGDLDLELLGQKGRVTGLLELGDVNAVDRELQALERTVAALAAPYARWLGGSHRAMRALLGGDLELAAQRIAESMVFAEHARSPDVSIELLVQSTYLRVELDRASEIVDAVREQVRRFPELAAWRLALARILIDCDAGEEATAVLEPLSRAGFDRLPRDRGRLFGWALAAEVARATRDVEAAARLEPLLRSCAALAVVAGSGTVYYGPVAHHQGEVAATLGRFDEAIERFTAARDAEERAGAPLWRARTQLALARVRASRGGDGDAQAAERTLAEVARIAAERGWAAVLRAARAQTRG